MLNVIDSGAEDIQEENDFYEITVNPAHFMNLRKNLEKKNVEIKSSEITYVPKTTVEVSKKDAQKVFRLINLLDDSDDIQNVYSNVELSDEILEEVE